MWKRILGLLPWSGIFTGVLAVVALFESSLAPAPYVVLVIGLLTAYIVAAVVENWIREKRETTRDGNISSLMEKTDYQTAILDRLEAKERLAASTLTQLLSAGESRNSQRIKQLEGEITATHAARVALGSIFRFPGAQPAKLTVAPAVDTIKDLDDNQD